MNLNKILPAVFFLSIIIVLIGAFLKIQHFEGSHIVLIAGLLSQVILAFLCLYEIASSNKFSKTEQLIWLLSFIFLPILAGLIYILSVRKRITNKL
jgi:hypothetical protein